MFNLPFKDKPVWLRMDDFQRSFSQPIEARESAVNDLTVVKKSGLKIKKKGHRFNENNN